MIIKINLPKPSDNLINLVKSVANDYIESHRDFNTWRHQPAKGNEHVNNAYAAFLFNESIDKIFHEEYRGIFKHQTRPLCGIIKNSKNDQLACYPPHVDDGRRVALNFYITPGGNNVLTTFYPVTHYRLSDPIPNLSYKDATIESQCSTEMNEWYILDPRKFHSVENILDTRLLLSVSVDCFFENFIKEYQTILN